MIKRNLKQKITNMMFKNKVLIIYGARQTGKTTLVKEIIKDYESTYKTFYANCELASIKDILETNNEKQLKDFIADNKVIVFDEAQSIKNIGLTLKIIHDTFPEVQLIATGSSSFELANQVSEPLTGRARTYILYPVSLSELKDSYGLVELKNRLGSILIYGSYPAVIMSPAAEARDELLDISTNYLYKDTLKFADLQNSNILHNLLELLALQLGNEVSYSELASNLGISNHTVKKYIDILEKCFIVFSLRAYSRNHRKEINKSRKIYFYDLGLRNAISQNFSTNLKLRLDKGALWENFCILERLKLNQYSNVKANYYFWRLYTGSEIDYIEEYDGELKCFEFKYSAKKQAKLPLQFKETYPNSSFQVVNTENYYDFLVK
jgi:predicted AAA+ superfamily ATPase